MTYCADMAAPRLAEPDNVILKALVNALSVMLIPGNPLDISNDITLARYCAAMPVGFTINGTHVNKIICKVLDQGVTRMESHEIRSII
ncbi:MAG: hypothetical protein ACR5K4_01395 [Sodalis sp. (in: enterobacteria)]